MTVMTFLSSAFFIVFLIIPEPKIITRDNKLLVSPETADEEN
jgi:hypothetical protein